MLVAVVLAVVGVVARLAGYDAATGETAPEAAAIGGALIAGGVIIGVIGLLKAAVALLRSPR